MKTATHPGIHRSKAHRFAIALTVFSALAVFGSNHAYSDSSSKVQQTGAPASSTANISLPPQAPPFLKDLPSVDAPYDPRQPATRKLKALIEENGYRQDFEDAIATVSAQGIPELSAIKTLDQFYYFLDTMVTWIPEIRVWGWSGTVFHERTVYLRIVQFYYYFNQPTLQALQSPIKPSLGEKLTPVSRWMRDFADEWGDFLDTPASGEYLKSFMFAPEYAWQDYEKPPEAYETFNMFFARKFKAIDVQRPVAQVDNDRVIVFPVESTFVGQWAVSTPIPIPPGVDWSQLPVLPSIVAKHIPWSIQELLQDSEYADAFEGGLFMHTFLNTYDYHRQHTPVAGKVLEAKFIPGQVYLKVELAEQGTEEDTVANGDIARVVVPQRYLNAEDRTGYQFVQSRGLLVLDSAIGKVAILPIGMAQVSSVVFVTPKADGQQPIVLTPAEKEGRDYQQQVDLVNQKIHTALVGKQLAKGEMFSYFQFGGSDCVMVFEREANVNVTARAGIHYPIRSQFGIANINNLHRSAKP